MILILATHWLISPLLSHFLRAPLSPLPDDPNTTKIVDKILKDDIITTKSSGTCRYLIHWKGKVATDDTWLDRDDLQRIDLDALERYGSTSTPN